MVSGKRQAAQDVTRALVLASARKQFAERGYDAANLRDIAAGAGRSVGAIFANWPDKETLFEEATKRKAPMRVIRDVLQRIVRSDGAYVGLGNIAARQLLTDLFGAT